MVRDNRALSISGNFEKFATSEIEREVATNLYDVTHAMRAALPVMRKQGAGRIININSSAG